MEQEKGTEKLLTTYFQKEKRKSESQALQKRIAQQMVKKSAFNWKLFVIPAAAMLLFIFGISVWKTQHEKRVTMAQTEVIYEDEDLVIYIKE